MSVKHTDPSLFQKGNPYRIRMVLQFTKTFKHKSIAAAVSKLKQPNLVHIHVKVCTSCILVPYIYLYHCIPEKRTCMVGGRVKVTWGGPAGEKRI